MRAPEAALPPPLPAVDLTLRLSDFGFFLGFASDLTVSGSDFGFFRGFLADLTVSESDFGFFRGFVADLTVWGSDFGFFRGFDSGDGCSLSLATSIPLRPFKLFSQWLSSGFRLDLFASTKRCFFL